MPKQTTPIEGHFTSRPVNKLAFYTAIGSITTHTSPYSIYPKPLLYLVKGLCALSLYLNTLHSTTKLCGDGIIITRPAVGSTTTTLRQKRKAAEGLKGPCPFHTLFHSRLWFVPFFFPLCPVNSPSANGTLISSYHHNITTEEEGRGRLEGSMPISHSLSQSFVVRSVLLPTLSLKLTEC